MKQPIGVFDSGVGGLSVLRYMWRELPYEDVVYVADQANIPYGPQSAENIRRYAYQITQYLLKTHHCKLIAIPCNTATAKAINFLREQFPDVPIVGIEPAVKPGAKATRSGKVGVLATFGTFESQRYVSLMQRYAADVELFGNPCVGLVPLIEEGNLAAAVRLLRPILLPMLQQNIDTLVLGCTHYPFVTPLIREIVGNDITIIDPAPAVARQVRRMIEAHCEKAVPGVGVTRFFTTGDKQQFAKQLATLLDRYPPVEHVSVPID
ncbi:MAG: glutamate racemase [Candidatus Promineifilaceae bacterium]